MADIQKYSEQTFESIKHINEYGQEFWYARELQTALEYTEWRNFKKIIDKAKDACATSGNPVGEHFVEVNKSSPMPNGGVREVEDFMLSRYACYLIVMNGDPRKEVIHDLSTLQGRNEARHDHSHSSAEELCRGHQERALPEM